MKNDTRVAYLSMEIALENKIKTFSGGLGVLAGDMLKSASDMKFPMIGITLLNKNGYFKQSISEEGNQKEAADKSDYSNLELLAHQIVIKIKNDKVLIKVWRYILKTENGIDIPIYLLDSDVAENQEKYRKICSNLYDGDLRVKLRQEIVLGRAGIKLLKKIGCENISKIHLNEGHGALAAVELFLSSKKKTQLEKIKEVRNKLVFTTHTPVKAAHDVFYGEFLLKYQPDFPVEIPGLVVNDKINFSNLALFFSSYANGVSKKHGRIAQNMFPEYKIKSITNGVNSYFWTAPEFKKLFDLHIPRWRDNSKLLKKAKHIPLAEIKEAHLSAKKRLIDYIEQKKGIRFKEDVLTITFARRFAPYKRPSLLLSDINKLKEINKQTGKIQIIYTGKAHPNDVVGKSLINEVMHKIKKIANDLKIVFIENYDLEIAKILVAGSDLWLNNPVPPNEASATSGMKAAHNAVPQASTWDGWWPEAYHRGKTGWLINDNHGKNDLYHVLANQIVPLYYQQNDKYFKICRQSISYNAAYFNTHRMLQEYIKKAYKNKICIKF